MKLCESLKGKFVLKNQLLRSGTSIGAKVHEANYAQSKADFAAKLQIALKECHETEYWLKLLFLSEYISSQEKDSLLEDCLEIKKILISTINTSKSKS